MNCPNCGIPYSAGSRFCGSCGAALPVAANPVPPPYVPPVQQPKNPSSTPGTLGGLSGLAGGVLVVIGWLMPWFGVGSFGLGSGMQLAFVTMLGALLGGQSQYTGGLAIVAIVLFALLVTIPVLGVLNVLGGNRTFGWRNITTESGIADLNDMLNQMRSRSIAGLILMVLIFATVSLIPFGSSALATGFFLTAVGFGVTFLGVLVSKS
jgi:hypothetical protein